MGMGTLTLLATFQLAPLLTSNFTMSSLPVLVAAISGVDLVLFKKRNDEEKEEIERNREKRRYRQMKSNKERERRERGRQRGRETETERENETNNEKSYKR